MATPKKYNIIPLIVTFVLLGTLLFFTKPNKLITYLRANVGTKNTILLYTLDKNSTDYAINRSNLGSFLTQRGISGTAYENSDNEYYVTIIPADVNATTEEAFGFVEVTPEDFYKTVYGARQVYFTRSLILIE